MDVPTKSSKYEPYERAMCPQCGRDRRKLRKMLVGKNADEREGAAEMIRQCKTCSSVFYALYRKITGRCETCDAPMEKHPRCKACDSLCGIGHEETSLSYRGHNLCGHCQRRWSKSEDLSWEEFLKGEGK